MDRSVQFLIEEARWRTQIDKFSQATGRTGRDFLRQRFRLLMEQVIKFSPPRNLAQGRKAVARDINRAVSVFGVDRITDPRLKQIWSRRDYPAFNAFAAALRQPWSAAPFSPDLHEKQRNARGIVRRRSRRVFVLGRADTGALRGYVRKKQANVGIARSGWLAGLFGVSNSVGWGQPSWVTRHGIRFGAFNDWSAHPDDPTLEAVNRSPWARRYDEGTRVLTNAMVAARRNMLVEMRMILSRAATPGR